MHHPVTTEQLARLYAARNEANKRMGQALRSRDKDAIALAKQQATSLNHAYGDALRAYKKQQKAARKAQWRTTMIRFYMDAQHATQATEPGCPAPAH